MVNVKKLMLAVMVLLLGVMLSVNAGVDMYMSSHSIRGAVLRSDGETPVISNVTVWDMDQEEALYRLKTDKHGVFETPPLSAGSYIIDVGGVRLALRIGQPRANSIVQQHSVVIVLPKRMPLAPLLIPMTPMMTLPRIMSP